MINKSIGFFDSGVGGLSVLKDACSLMPEENYIYYGDSANAPYGEKSREEIFELTMRGIGYLMSNDIKALVIACNTATSAVIDELRKEVDIPVIGMEPAIKPALAAVEGKVLMMATPATIKLERYNNLLERFNARERVVNLACNKLAGMIDHNVLSRSDELNNYLCEILAPYRNLGIEAIVLGCTHYVFIREDIKEAFGQNVLLFDGNRGTVNRLKSVLEEKGIKRSPDAGKGAVVLNSSSDDQFSMKTYSKLFYGR